MKNSILFLLILAIALIGGAGLFYLASRLPDNDMLNRDVNAQLLKIDGLNSSINELALRSRANLDSNYDMLVRATTTLERTVSELSDSYFHTREITGSLLEKRFDSFRDSVEIKIDHVESFKSSNSVLRNSEKYTPFVGNQLIEVSQQNKLTSNSDFYKKVVLDILEFSKLGSTKALGEIAEHAGNIRKTEPLMPESSSIKLLEFANHVATVIDSKQKTDRYLNLVLNSSTDDQIEQISSAWGLWQSTNNNAQQTLRYYMIAYVLTMMGLMGLLVFRLRNLYNNLDTQVEAKTAQIKVAYNELHNSERKLVQTEKMASLGQLVAGVAHEINTPLGYVSSNMNTISNRFSSLTPLINNVSAITDMLTSPNRDNKAINELLRNQITAYKAIGKVSATENTVQLINDSTQGLQEIKEIVDSLTNFSHVQDAPLADVDVHESLRSALKMTGPAVGQRKIMTNLTSNIPPIKGIANQLIQVFTNIITNACHATTADKGVIIIKTRSLNKSVVVIFKDNGRGMDSEALKRAFDPFFTTKEVGEGTGLGLSIAYKIIESYGGQLKIESKKGLGTTAIVELPLSAS